MTFTQQPRLLARIAGVFYVIIVVFAVFAYVYVRGRLIISGDMAQTATNLMAHEQLYRLGVTAALVVVICNLPLGWIFFELLKVVNPRLALLALIFITASATLEAVNLVNYISPLLMLTLPEYLKAFDPVQRQALARGSIKLFGYGFNVCLMSFGVFCGLNGYLIFRSRFFPRVLGLLMIAAGVSYWINSFVLFLALPEIPYPLRYLLQVTPVGEALLALWLLVVGVNDKEWHAQVDALRNSGIVPG
jgi:Domain of unknown function (DUF4386)